MGAIKILLASVMFIILAGFSHAMIYDLTSCSGIGKNISFTYVNGSTGTIHGTECGPLWSDPKVIGMLNHFCIQNNIIGDVFTYDSGCQNQIPDVASCSYRGEHTDIIEGTLITYPDIIITYSNGITETKPQSECGKSWKEPYTEGRIIYNCVGGVDVGRYFEQDSQCESQEIPEFNSSIALILAIIGGIIIFAVQRKQG